MHGLNKNDVFLDYMTLLVSTYSSDIFDENGARARNRSKACCKGLINLVGINIQSPQIQSYNCYVHQTLESLTAVIFVIPHFEIEKSDCGL